MVTELVFPDLFGEEVVDLRENFHARRGWFFSLALANIVASVCKHVVLDGALPPPETPTSLSLLACPGIAAEESREPPLQQESRSARPGSCFGLLMWIENWC